PGTTVPNHGCLQTSSELGIPPGSGECRIRGTSGAHVVPMMKPSATKTALVIAVLATPALAGGGKPNLKPVAVTTADKAVVKLAPLPVEAPVEVKPESKKLVESYDLGKVSLGE